MTYCFKLDKLKEVSKGKVRVLSYKEEILLIALHGDGYAGAGAVHTARPAVKIQEGSGIEHAVYLQTYTHRHYYKIKKS